MKQLHVRLINIYCNQTILYFSFLCLIRKLVIIGTKNIAHNFYQAIYLLYIYINFFFYKKKTNG
jgi:hypothetical protein